MSLYVNLTFLYLTLSSHKHLFMKIKIEGVSIFIKKQIINPL